MQKQEADHVSLLLLLLDPFLPMLASLLHAISSTTEPGKLIFYDTLRSLETKVTNSGINTKSVFISITCLLLLIPLNDFTRIQNWSGISISG